MWAVKLCSDEILPFLSCKLSPGNLATISIDLADGCVGLYTVRFAVT